MVSPASDPGRCENNQCDMCRVTGVTYCHAEADYDICDGCHSEGYTTFDMTEQGMDVCMSVYVCIQHF